MKIFLLTNIPAPYRIPVFNRVADVLGDDFLVVFCAKTEPNRLWDVSHFAFRHEYLNENFKVSRGSFIHNNRDVLGALKRFLPDVVITTGFNPTSLYAWGYSLLSGKCHIPMTDGWIMSEHKLGFKHRLVRRLVFRTSKAFIGAGKKSLELYKNYGIGDEHLFKSHLCIDNSQFIRQAQNMIRPYDLMFAGQIIERKMPDFFIDVVTKVKEIRGKARVLIIGDGPLRERMLTKLAERDIDVDYSGFVPQKDLSGFYCRARILLFTTSNDPWGIVANEALASGTPVITCPCSGVADDLVVNGRNGYVVVSNVAVWVDKVVGLLDNASLWEEMHTNAVESVHDFTFENAAKGIIAASEWAFCRS
jgi:glycosyltransferase involved in cell wall biosynthesis